MTLLNLPALLWLALVPALVLIYMFRPRRRRTPVPSLRLWRELPRVERSTSQLRRPPISLLLLLQALLLVAGALALAQPAFTAPAGSHRVIALDASGSMLTRDGGRSRFDLARDGARQAVLDLGPQDSATLLRVGANVTTLCSGCSKVDYLAALEAARPGAGVADMQALMGVVSGLARRTEGSPLPVTIISDGEFSPLATASLPAMSLDFVRVGASKSDAPALSVVALSARRPPDGRSGWIAYARIENRGGTPAGIRISALADTVPLPERTQILPAGGSVGITWQVPALTRRFSVAVTPGDALSADDRAAIFLPVDGQVRVGLMSPQPELYRRALSVIDGVLPLTGTAGAVAFTLIEGAPPTELPAGGLVLVNPVSEEVSATAGITLGLRFLSEAKDARPTFLDNSHPLLAGVDLSALAVAEAADLERPDWLQTVAAAAGAPLVLAGEQDGRRVVLFTFDPRKSNLPTLAAFPLLMANITDWLYPLAGMQSVQPGAQLRLLPGSTVETPGGRTYETGPTGLFLDTDEAGTYTVRVAGLPETHFSVNLADVAPLSTSASLAHPELEQPRPGAGAEVKENEFWLALAGAALALLLGEWLLYCWKRGSV